MKKKRKIAKKITSVKMIIYHAKVADQSKPTKQLSKLHAPYNPLHYFYMLINNHKIL